MRLNGEGMTRVHLARGSMPQGNKLLLCRLTPQWCAMAESNRASGDAITMIATEYAFARAATIRSWSRVANGCVDLRFAVATRYPGKNATKREVTSALRWAGKIRMAARMLLEFRPRHTRKKSLDRDRASTFSAACLQCSSFGRLSATSTGSH